MQKLSEDFRAGVLRPSIETADEKPRDPSPIRPRYKDEFVIPRAHPAFLPPRHARRAARSRDSDSAF